MNKNWKKGIQWVALSAGTLLTIAFIFLGGRYIAVQRDPSSAFIKVSALPTTSPRAQAVSENLTRPKASASSSSSSPVSAPSEAIQSLNPSQSDAVETPSGEATQNAFQGSGDIVSISLLGIDTTPDREKKKMGWRSDTIAVCVVNLSRKTATVISVPRDTRARVQKLNAKGNVIGERMDKINAAYAYGGGVTKFSHQNAIQAISTLLGIDVRYYASIDMDSIAPLADSMGGVELTLEDTVPGVGKRGETVLLKGDKAYKYIRRRKGITGGSDIARAERQQLFLKAAALKLKNMGPLSAVPVMLSALGGRVRTNLSLDQVLALSTVLRQVDVNSIEFVTLPGKCRTIGGVSYYIADPSAIKSLIRRVTGQGEQEAAS